MDDRKNKRPRRAWRKLLAVLAGAAWMAWMAAGQARAEVLTPLMAAARDGDTGMVRMLSADRGQVNAQSGSLEFRLHGTPLKGRTALMFAAGGGHVEAVRILLEHGADPDIVDSYGQTAWSHALEAQQLPVLQMLYPAVSAASRPRYVQTGLYSAAQNGALPIVEFLLDKAQDPGAVSQALAGAAGNARMETVQYLVQHKAVISGEVMSRAVQYAGQPKQEVLRYLLENGADPNVRYTQPAVGIEAMTPLMLASYLNYYPQALDVMILLLAHGADPAMTDGKGRSLAEIARNPDAQRFLKSAGDFVSGEVRDDRSGAPVAGAAVSLKFAVVKPGQAAQQLMQQTVTDERGRYYIHTWQHPMRRESGWEMAPDQAPSLAVYAQGYHRLALPAKQNGGGNGMGSRKPLRLAALPADQQALRRELQIWRADIDWDRVESQPGADRTRTEEGLRPLIVRFGAACESLPADVRAATCYAPCSSLDHLVQRFKYEDGWLKERKREVAIATARQRSVPTAMVMKTACGYVVRSDSQSEEIIIQGPGNDGAAAPMLPQSEVIDQQRPPPARAK